MKTNTEEEKREALPVRLRELRLIVEALDNYYKRSVKWTNRRQKGKPRSIEDTKRLAQMQETLQYITLIRNIRAKTLNAAVAESGGITIDGESNDSTGQQVVDGDKGEETVS